MRPTCLPALVIAVLLAASVLASAQPPGAVSPGQAIYQPTGGPPNLDRRWPKEEPPFAFRPADASTWTFNPTRLSEWLNLVDRHRPGQRDEAVVQVGKWTDLTIANAVLDFQAARAMFVKARRRKAPDRAFALGVLHMTETEFAEQDTRPVLKRAILLHTDLAVGGLASTLHDTTVKVSQASFHSGLALALVEELAGEFPGDPAVHDWFLATAAALQGALEYLSSPPFLRRAVKRFPNDQDLLTLAGMAHELLASHRVQETEAAQSDTEEGRQIRGKRLAALEVAADCYARALTVGPPAVETRVHYGRVLGERGQRAEAVDALRPAAGADSPEPLRYLALLFMADDLAALDRAQEADAAYRQAVALYPSAPSGHFAFSAAARRRNDYGLAVNALPLKGDDDNGPTIDPWNAYFEIDLTRDAASLLAALRGQLARRR